MRSRFALIAALFAGAVLATAPASAGPVGAAAGSAEVTAKAADVVHMRRKHRRHVSWRHHRRHSRHVRLYSYGYSPYYYRPYGSYYPYPTYWSAPRYYYGRPRVGVYIRF